MDAARNESAKEDAFKTTAPRTPPQSSRETACRPHSSADGLFFPSWRSPSRRRRSRRLESARNGGRPIPGTNLPKPVEQSEKACSDACSSSDNKPHEDWLLRGKSRCRFLRLLAFRTRPVYPTGNTAFSDARSGALKSPTSCYASRWSFQPLAVVCRRFNPPASACGFRNARALICWGTFVQPLGPAHPATRAQLHLLVVDLNRDKS